MEQRRDHDESRVLESFETERLCVYACICACVSVCMCVRVCVFVHANVWV